MRTSSCCSLRRRSWSVRRGWSTSRERGDRRRARRRAGSGWGGVIVVTNPVDPLVTRLQRERASTGARPRLHDERQPPAANRPRRSMGVPPGVSTLGFSASTATRAFRSSTGSRVDGVAFAPQPRQAAAAEEFLRTWYVRHVALDSGGPRPGLGPRRRTDGGGARRRRRVWPSSVVLEGEYGIEGVAVTVPVTIGRRGVEQIHEWKLDLPISRRYARRRRSSAPPSTASTAAGPDGLRIRSDSRRRCVCGDNVLAHAVILRCSLQRLKIHLSLHSAHATDSPRLSPCRDKTP